MARRGGLHRSRGAARLLGAAHLLRATLAAGLLTAVLVPAGLAAAPPAAQAQAAPTPHAEAEAALAGTTAAIRAIVQAADVSGSGPAPFRQAASEALAALAGPPPPADAPPDADAVPSAGALGHLNWLLHRPGAPPWNAAVEGAWVNVTAAVDELRQALADHGLDEFQEDATAALENLEVAVGRDSVTDGLGGLDGALANTVLGVPDGARIVPGCRAPAAAPAWGVTDGHLLYVALPSRGGEVVLPQGFGTRAVTLGKGFVVVHTAAAAGAAQLCGGHKQAALAPSAGSAATVLLATAADPAPPSGARAPPQLYTLAQAQAGRTVYMKTCVTCHGDQLQGRSAPPNAGTIFLHKAQALDWTISNLRTLVVSSMPLTNPGSLSPVQYADVLAFLLASDCYPAGHRKFPLGDTSLLQRTRLAAVAGAKPDNPTLGTCRVK
jgi:polar amino acid transport system substrate-binding protein